MQRDFFLPCGDPCYDSLSFTDGDRDVRFLAAVLVGSSFFSFNAFADEYPEMKSMKEFHSAICKDHNKPELCERVVGIMMKSVMQNDDIHFECQKLTPSQRADEEGCQSAEAIRQMITGFN